VFVTHLLELLEMPIQALPDLTLTIERHDIPVLVAHRCFPVAVVRGVKDSDKGKLLEHLGCLVEFQYLTECDIASWLRLPDYVPPEVGHRCDS